MSEGHPGLGGQPPLRILVYGLNYAPEPIGIGKYTHEMCEWLRGRGHAIRVVTSYPHYPEWQVEGPHGSRGYRRETYNGVDVVRCPIYVPRKPSGSKRLLSHALFAASSAPVLVSTALKFRPDVVFTVAPSLLNAPVALLGGKLSRSHRWLHVQDFEVDSAFELGILSGSRWRRLAETIECKLLSGFDRVSSISPKMVERLGRKGTSKTRTIEFRNWVDTSFICPQPRMTALRAELGLTADHTVALYSGSMSLKQGLETVVAAANQLAAPRPDIAFVLCGNGPVRQKLEELARGSTNIRFLDLQPQDRLAELLATGDVHLLPQKAEVADLVLPSKLGPMLASARPVVAMAASGTQLAEEIADAGIVIPPDQPTALADALTALADDADLRAKLGAAGRAYSQSRWSIQPILEGFERHLLALADREHFGRPVNLVTRDIR